MKKTGLLPEELLSRLVLRRHPDRLTENGSACGRIGAPASSLGSVLFWVKKRGLRDTLKDAEN